MNWYLFLFIFIGVIYQHVPVTGRAHRGTYSSAPIVRHAYVHRYRGESTRSKIVFISTGGVYMSPYYHNRYRSNNYDQSIDMCYNEIDSPFINDTSYGHFTCPLTYDTSKTYCCGTQFRQHCCGFFDEPGRAAGTIIGIIIAFLVILAVIIFFFYKHFGRFRQSA